MKKQKFLVRMTPVYSVTPLKGSKGKRYFAFKTKTHHVRKEKISIIVVATARESFEIFNGWYHSEDHMKKNFIYSAEIPITQGATELLEKAIESHFNMKVILPKTAEELDDIADTRAAEEMANFMKK